MSKKKVKKLLVIGWDAAEWKVIEPMIEQGLMPTLKKFLSEGVSGKIATLDPPFSPMLWTSIATGKRAYDHGIMGFIEPTPTGDGLRPVLSTSRKVKAIWNILNQTGHKSNVIGWWPSHPAEPINGVMVSNFYQNFKEGLDKPWTMAAGAIHPESMMETFSQMRVHGDEITQPMIEMFIPNIKEVMDKYFPIFQDKEASEEDKKRATAFINRTNSVAKNIATCTSIHSVGTYVLRETEWDFTAVYLDTIDHFSHIGMKFHPPKMEFVDQEMYDAFNNIVTAGYRWHDMLLERTLSLIDEDTTVMILSDHGFHPDNLRPKKLPLQPAAPALEHSPFGFFAMKGPGIKKGEKIYGATLLDITPTILHLYGLPIGLDMEGTVLQQIFEDELIEKVDTVPTWETIEGDTGTHSEASKSNPWADQEAMQQLIDLGYVDKPGENIMIEVEKAIAEANFYLARAYINGNKYPEGIRLLEEITAKYPDVHRYAVRLVTAYLFTKKYKRARTLIDHIKTLAEYPKIKVDTMDGVLCIHTYKVKKAIRILKKVEAESTSPYLLLQLGRAFNMTNKWKEAEKSYLASIALDPNNHMAYHGLGITYLRRNQYEKAIDSFLKVIEISNDSPQTHYCIGEALFKLKQYDQAIEAFTVALHFNPNLYRAHYLLSEIYGLKNMHEKSAFHKEKAEEFSQGKITIVTGLQRSGTSLMMQMLKELGGNLLYDDERAADEFNPKGYFEYTPANNILKNKEWLKKADNHIVKIYAKNIMDLPKNYKYKIIWMDRPMEEITKSYNKMKSKWDKGYSMVLADKLTEQVDNSQTWIESMPQVEFMVVNYHDLLENPLEELEDIKSFLGEEMFNGKIALESLNDLKSLITK